MIFLYILLMYVYTRVTRNEIFDPECLEKASIHGTPRAALIETFDQYVYDPHQCDTVSLFSQLGLPSFFISYLLCFLTSLRIL